MEKICETEIKKIPGGGWLVILTNCKTGEWVSKPYKTEAAAKGACTRFTKAMVRIYG